jgi:hypothetical protein
VIVEWREMTTPRSFFQLPEDMPIAMLGNHVGTILNHSGRINDDDAPGLEFRFHAVIGHPQSKGFGFYTSSWLSCSVHLAYPMMFNGVP